MTEHEVTIEVPAFSITLKVSATEIVPPDPEPEPLPEPGTAFTIVQNNTVVDPHDLYVCNVGIDTVAFDPKRKPGSLVLFYSVSQLMPSYGATNMFLNGLRAVATEADYWHTANPPSINNRLRQSVSNWYVRATPNLAKRIADYIIAKAPAYYQGTMADESQPELPDYYLAPYRTAVEWNEGNLAQVKADWVASVNMYLNTLKAAWGSTKAVVANTGGTPGPDGFTVENAHILAQGAGGIDWVKANAAAQKKIWDANPNRFGIRPIIATWNCPTKIPEIYFGTAV
jgi:hypothetical protein